ncbi:MAG TPA: hypothetical protein VIC71_13470 [Gammaproteobacteria bacterium]|jgi:hypothetical protein
MPFREGQEVRIKALLKPKRWERHEAISSREPVVGDIGLVVDVDASTGRMIYTVECIDTHGSERWLTQFEQDELEPIPAR